MNYYTITAFKTQKQGKIFVAGKVSVLLLRIAMISQLCLQLCSMGYSAGLPRTLFSCLNTNTNEIIYHNKTQSSLTNAQFNFRVFKHLLVQIIVNERGLLVCSYCFKKVNWQNGNLAQVLFDKIIVLQNGNLTKCYFDKLTVW